MYTGRKWLVRPTISFTPLARAAAIISSHCSSVSAMGFSTSTCLPAFSASTLSRWCSW